MTSTGVRGGRKRGPSIGDVARLAGVSAQTVSRVSTGADVVRPETRDRVLHAMEQLGYSPNHAARALRGGRYGTIGLLAHRFDRTGEALTADAVLRAAEDENHSVTLLRVHHADSDEWEPAARRLHHQTVDGIIIIRAEGGAADLVSVPRAMPVAVMDSRLHGRYPHISSAETAGARLATEHLLDLGHRTVHHVAGPANSEPARMRTIGWRASLTDRHCEVREPLVGDWTSLSGYAAGRTLAADPSVTAVFCANDDMAFGLMLALHEAGRSVPGDVSVVGYDGVTHGAFSIPPLSTIRQDFPTMGKELVRMVLSQLGQPPGFTVPDVVIPAQLVVRQSTAPPRR